MARGSKFLIWVVEGLYYLCSENKGADQLRGYREADLRLFFSHMQKIRFSYDEAHIINHSVPTFFTFPWMNQDLRFSSKEPDL